MPKEKIDQIERAGRAWPLLCTVATTRSTITYKRLGDLLEVHHRAVGALLSPIQDYCLGKGLPPLTILVVNQHGIPGSGFIAWRFNDLDEGFRRVWIHPWAVEDNPFDLAGTGWDFEAVVRELLRPLGAAEVFSRIHARGVGQVAFREAVMRAYGWRCAISGSQIKEGLDAAHIVPWAKASPVERLDVRNGIALTVWYHRLFDRGLLHITPDLRIELADGLRGSLGAVDERVLGSLHGASLTLPNDENMRPLSAFLTRRAEGKEP